MNDRAGMTEALRRFNRIAVPLDGRRAAAVAIAKQMGPGHTIVTILCDGGQKYASRLYNPVWVNEKGFTDAIK